MPSNDERKTKIVLCNVLRSFASLRKLIQFTILRSNTFHKILNNCELSYNLMKTLLVCEALLAARELVL